MSWGTAPLDDTLRALWMILMGDGRGLLVLRWFHETHGRQEHRVGLRDRERFVRLVTGLGVDRELEMFAAARHPDRLGVARDGIMCAWARCESKESVKRLDRFWPQPTVVLQEGDAARVVAFWSLTRAHTVEQAARANKRIAHALRAPKKYADPDSFLFSPPGTFLRAGRKRPVPVTVRSLRCAIYPPRQVYGRLRDAPAADAWRERSAA